MFSDGIQNKIYILRRRAWVQEVWIGIWWLIGCRKCDVKEEHFCFTWITTERVVMSFPERRNRGERTSLRGSGKSSFEHGLRCRWLSGVRVRAQEKERDGHQSLRTFRTRVAREPGYLRGGQEQGERAESEGRGYGRMWRDNNISRMKGEPEKRKSGSGRSQKEKRDTSGGRPAWQQPKWSKI